MKKEIHRVYWIDGTSMVRYEEDGKLWDEFDAEHRVVGINKDSNEKD